MISKLLASQMAITYSKLIETLEQGVKYVQSQQYEDILWRHQDDAIGVVLVSLLLTLNIFHALF